jgi:hypothetical protein
LNAGKHEACRRWNTPRRSAAPVGWAAEGGEGARYHAPDAPEAAFAFFFEGFASDASAGALADTVGAGADAAACLVFFDFFMPVASAGALADVAAGAAISVEVFALLLALPDCDQAYDNLHAPFTKAAEL